MKSQKTMRDAIVAYIEEHEGRLSPSEEEIFAVYLLGDTSLVDTRGELWRLGLRFNYVGATGGWTIEDFAHE